MKIILIIYIFLSYLINIKTIIVSPNITDIGNLLFLNISSFQSYNLESLNIPYIIMYCLLIYIIIAIDFSTINEQTSYLYLLLYRLGKNKLYTKLLIKNVENNLKILISILTCILLFILLENKTYNIITIIPIILFLIRFITIFIIFNTIHDTYQLIGKNNKAHYITLFSISILLLTDILFNTNFITYSNDTTIELLLLFLSLLIMIGTVMMGLLIFKKKGDVL